MINLRLVLAASLAAALGAAGCGSSSSNNNSTDSGTSGTGSATITCVATILGSLNCVSETNVPASNQAALKTSCTGASKGKLEPCPTANLIGCCSTITTFSNGQKSNHEVCYYFPPADAGAVDAGGLTNEEKSVCTSISGGKWSTSP